jgi:hypothetical protein
MEERDHALSCDGGGTVGDSEDKDGKEGKQGGGGGERHSLPVSSTLT